MMRINWQSERQNICFDIRRLKKDLADALDGMDNCLDWKNDSDNWSAREIIYHLVDTPPEGMDSLIRRILNKPKGEFELIPDLTNVTGERLLKDVKEVKGDVFKILDNLELLIKEASDVDLTGKTILVHLLARGVSADRTASNLLHGLFVRHWFEHVAQLYHIRVGLGL